jgi:predicted Ser/Thr protein kinase
MNKFDQSPEPHSQPSSLASDAGRSGGSPVSDEKARARERVGDTVNGKWRLDALLGIGGMASVYAATHRNGSRAALKILHAEFGRDPGIRDRFLREGYVANKVDHQGRVAILDDDVTENEEPYLVMELLEGETVQQLWKRRGKKLPIGEALWIAAEVLDVLAAFHALGIVHRDLKPANIFVTRDDKVKILDFGVARMRDATADHTRAGTALGTPSFMAPEQAMGLVDGIDGRADVFSMGATLYALLSGQRLHQGRSENEAFILAATSPAPSIARVAPDLPVEIIALVDKALAWDMRQRWAGAAEMEQEVRSLLLTHQEGARGSALAPAVRAAEPMGFELASAAEQARGLERPRVARADATPAPQARPAPRAEPRHDARVEARVEEVAAQADEPAVLRLTEVFRRLDKLLPTVRQYGWAHPESDHKLRGAHQTVVEGLRAVPEDFYVTLTPYAFVHRGQTVWEPGPPLDAIPYQLFAAGLRRLQLTPGFSEEGLRSLCEVMMLDPVRDLLPEDDVAAALWERRIDCLQYEALDLFAEGDADEREAFYAEADDLERIARRSAEEKANRAEAMAMAVATDAEGMRAARDAAAVLALDPAARAAIASQLVLTPERWSERYVDVLAEALKSAQQRNDLALVTDPLDANNLDLVRARRLDVAFHMYRALLAALRLDPLSLRQKGGADRNKLSLLRDLTQGMFAPLTTGTMLRELGLALAPGQPRPEGDLEAVLADVKSILDVVGASHLDAILSASGAVLHHDELRAAVHAYFERVLRGNEALVVDRVLTLDENSARPVLGVLSALGSPGADDALRRLSHAPNVGLRCEALAALLRDPERIKDELFKICETAPEPELRSAALRTLARHQIRQAGPLLVKRVQDNAFHQLAPPERAELLGALWTLHPARAEQICVELVLKHGLLGDEQLDQSRMAAAELLGRESRAVASLEAVCQAARKRWWNTPALREKAQAAAEALAARLGKKVGPGGELE